MADWMLDKSMMELREFRPMLLILVIVEETKPKQIKATQTKRHAMCELIE